MFNYFYVKPQIKMTSTDKPSHSVGEPPTEYIGESNVGGAPSKK